MIDIGKIRRITGHAKIQNEIEQREQAQETIDYLESKIEDTAKKGEKLLCLTWRNDLQNP